MLHLSVEDGMTEPEIDHVRDAITAAMSASNPSASIGALVVNLIPDRCQDDWLSSNSRTILAWLIENSRYRNLADIRHSLVIYGVEDLLIREEAPNKVLALVSGRAILPHVEVTLSNALSPLQEPTRIQTAHRHPFPISGERHSLGE